MELPILWAFAALWTIFVGLVIVPIGVVKMPGPKSWVRATSSILLIDLVLFLCIVVLDNCGPTRALLRVGWWTIPAACVATTLVLLFVRRSGFRTSTGGAVVLLLLVSLPDYGATIWQANVYSGLRDSHCKSRLTLVGRAIGMYTQDYGALPPAGRCDRRLGVYMQKMGWRGIVGTMGCRTHYTGTEPDGKPVEVLAYCHHEPRGIEGRRTMVVYTDGKTAEVRGYGDWPAGEARD